MQQVTLDPNKPFYFTNTPPPQPQVKRGTWVIPVIVAVVSLVVIVAGFGAIGDSGQPQPATSQPSPKPTPSSTPTPQPSIQVTPTPTPSSTPQSQSLPDSEAPAISRAPATPVPSKQAEAGLPWNANVKLTQAYSVMEVRSIPSDNGGVIGIVEQGDAVKILTAPISVDGAFWVCVQKGGYSGWVKSEFLEVRQ